MLPPSTYLLRPRRLIFVDEMTTTDKLNDEIRALQKKVVDWETQLVKLLDDGTEGMTSEQKQNVATKIKFFGDWISDNNKIILQMQKRAAAREKHRLERGETTAAPITLYLFSFIKLSSVSFLHPP